MKKLSLNEYLFLKWVNKTHPQMFASVAGDPREALSGFMDSLSQGLQTFLAEAPKLYGQYLTGKREIAAMKMNVERLKAGQPPIDPATGQPISQYTPGYGVPPGSSFVDSVPTWAWLAGAGLLAVLLFKR